MLCKIDNIETLYLKSVNGNIENPLNCSHFEYNSQNMALTCFLSNDKNSNPLMKYGESIFEYGYYTLTYSNNKYPINNKAFYLSQDIENADFLLEKDKQIDPYAYTTVLMKTRNKKFYLPYIEKIYYNDNLGRFNPITTDFEIVFNDNSKYIFFKIFIEYSHIYSINKICRSPCFYCRNSNCWENIYNYSVFSNTKNITFKFNRKYIILNNSTDINGNKNTELEIEIEGKDRQKLVNLIIIYSSENGDSIEMSKLEYNDKIIINNLKIGKYEFKYKIKEEEIEEEFIIKNKVVLVVNNDYEIFNLTELKKSCFYYNNTNGELCISLSANKNYKFKDYVNPNDLILIINNNAFVYSQNVFKKNNSDYFQNNNGFYILIKEKENQDLIITRINHPIKFTSFSLNPSINYFYKDNIVTINQICLLDNIFIKELDSNSKYYKLNCLYDNSKNKSYCETNYIFTNKKSNLFQFYIGNSFLSFYYPLDEIKLIYNSIKDANFMISYNNQITTIFSDNFNMNHINYTKIDKNIILFSNSFIEKNTELIIFKFEKQNNSLTDNFLMELVRFNHPEDISKTNINKTINLEIIEKECKENEIKYLGICFTCEAYSTYNIEFSDKNWFQDGKCLNQ